MFFTSIEEEAEVSAEDVRSKPFALEFPLDLSGRPAAVKVLLVVDAPGFQPHAQKEAISVPPYGDSEVCRFLLVAKQAGELKVMLKAVVEDEYQTCLLYTSPSPRDGLLSRMPSSA